ncbi:unnamed protein product (macronuclear) [Paramecium tetraurelia]|uniref:C2H2-type domain-containing protein n=1 Tax=Paramecium tetraurelia TaxID=5888 RepID=A0EDC5_PARTE|nr:uncharacterized protein GSPATT00004161001 [Paramecium tetraurelia]CAK93292.1 unnamed protein product [Paramecium tetraurelia]|eukprot:XP_001460689.1 hypothetical protein (macronuclear) [Paramecium tetraurelia strain d4-2]
MNEETQTLLKKILEMQLECTQLLTNILFKKNPVSNDGEQLNKKSEQLEEAKIQLDGPKRKSKKSAKPISYNDTLVQSEEDIQLQQLFQMTPKGQLQPEQCYKQLNMIVQKFKQLNSLANKSLQLDFEYIKAYHSKNKFRYLRAITKLFVKSIKNLQQIQSKDNQSEIFKCPSCDFSGISSVFFPHILKKHCQNYHIFCCFLCSKDYQSHTLLLAHLKKYHNNPKKNQKQETNSSLQQIDDVSISL